MVYFDLSNNKNKGTKTSFFHPYNLWFPSSSSLTSPRPSLWSSNPKTVALQRPPNIPFSPTQPSFAKGLEWGHQGQRKATTRDPQKKKRCTHKGDHRAGDTQASTPTLALCELCTHNVALKRTQFEEHYVFTYCRCVGRTHIARHELKQRHKFAWACAELNKLTLTL